MIPVTWSPAPRFSESSRTGALLRMLRSMSRRYPGARMMRRPAGFGVSSADNAYLVISTSGHWTDEELSDWLALFVIWLRADPEGLREPIAAQPGLSAEVTVPSQR